MKYLINFILLFISCNLFAQDIKGAYIRTAWVPTYTYTYEYTYSLTLITDGSIARPTATLYYGDLSVGTLTLLSETMVNGTSVKTYTSSHLYSGQSGDPPAHYKVEFVDSFRVAGLKNISNSQSEPVRTEARIYASSIAWTKSAGAITNFPPVLGLSGNKVFYDPMFEKATGTDSVSFYFKNCYASNYHLPNDATLDVPTGVLTMPKDSLGQYAFYIQICEWVRNLSNTPEISRMTFVDYMIDINATVGLNEQEKLEYIHVYPNPTNSLITLKTSLRGNKEITIQNITGQSLLKLNSAEQDFTINLGEFPEGVYCLQIKSNSGILTEKIVKK